MLSLLSLFIFTTLSLFSISPSRAALRTYTLTIHQGTNAPDGVSREVYLINGQQPGPLIEADEGDDIEVFVSNKLPVDTTIHWHGLLQRGTPQMDGVPGVTQYPIVPGGNFTYRFSTKGEYGFYWYHSHFRAYYNDAIRGPLLIRPSSSRARPFEQLATNHDDRQNLLEAEREATQVLLSDWTHSTSDAIYAQYFKTGAFPHCVDSILANGYGRVQCLPEFILQAGVGLRLDTGMPGMSGFAMGASNMSAASAGTAMQATSTKDSTLSKIATMPKMSMNDQMSASGTVMNIQNAPSPEPLMPRIPMNDQMTESMPQNSGMDPTTSMSSNPSMSMNSASTVSMATSSPDLVTSMPRMSMNDQMTGSTQGSSISNTATVMASMLSMSSMAPEPSSMSEMAVMSGIPPMSSASSMSSMQGMGPLNPKGCTPPMMFRPGYNISSLPIQTCTNTTSPLLKINANHMRGWLALNLVNAGAVSKLAVSLDSHSMFVYAADGLFTVMQEVKVLYLSVGQRYSVMIKLDQPIADYYLRYYTFPSGDMQQVLEGQAIVAYSMDSMPPTNTSSIQDDSSSVWTLKNGSAVFGAPFLDPLTLHPFAEVPPPAGKADVTKVLAISQTGIVTWVMNGSPYIEASTPILEGKSSDGWNADTTLHLPLNSTIDIIMHIANNSMDTMGHPMHLHGHKFWVLGSGTGGFPYSSVTDAPSSMINLRDPPYRDTTDLPPSGWVAIRYKADNPGAWLFHCHVQWHLMSGMALVLIEGEEKIVDLRTPQIF